MKLDISFYYTDEWKQISKSIKERDGFTCQVCGNDDWLEVHHIIPRIMGGTDTDDNLITLCKKCHELIPKGEDSGQIIFNER